MARGMTTVEVVGSPDRSPDLEALPTRPSGPRRPRPRPWPRDHDPASSEVVDGPHAATPPVGTPVAETEVAVPAERAATTDTAALRIAHRATDTATLRVVAPAPAAPPPTVTGGPPTVADTGVSLRTVAPAPPDGGDTAGAVDPAEAEEFLRGFHAENPEAGPVEPRMHAVRDEIAASGTYVHTFAELQYGARVAWRSSARCIGRLYWRSLHLRDRRSVSAPHDVADECVAHLRAASRRGRIRSTVTVFAPDTPTASGPRIWNEQLIRYAGYRAGGAVLGDPRYVGLTDTVRSLGWLPPSPMGRFDVLPLMVTGGGVHAQDGPQIAEVPPDAVLEVPLEHPEYPWFAELGLRWHAVPAISNMRLDVGGVTYPAAPFNGWYMATEIGARNLADAERYDLLAAVAEGMELDTSSDRTLWRDRAVIEMTAAVQHSFDTEGVSLADHHGESRRFLRHLEREEAAGRRCPVDWSWIVPPVSGGLTPVFHRYYDEPTDTGPMFRIDPSAQARGRGCPM